ncbi:MAG TPA: ABC transporter ATP-binding protein [Rhodothermales bacterium]
MALVSVSNVSKKFCRDLKRSLRYGLQDVAAEFLPWTRRDASALRRGEFWALQDVSFEMERGSALALLGPNGAGKSTMLKLLTGIIRPDAGEIRIRGKVASLIELGTGFNPVLNGRENIYINAAVLGFDRAYVDRLVDKIIDFAEIGEFVDAPVMSYSSGMYVRLAYAVAANLEPDVLLVDEVLAVGDASFRRKCIRHMKEYVEKGGSLIVVSHTPPLLEIVCNRSLVIDHGRVDFAGSISDGIDRYFALLGTDSVESGMSSAQQPRSTTDGADEAAAAEPEAPVSEVRRRVANPSETEPVKIAGIRIEPEIGTELLTGEPVILTLSYNAIRPIERVLWGLIFRLEGESLDIAAEVCLLEQLPAGRGEVRARIPRLPFVAGRYALRTALVDEAGQVPYDWLGWEDNPARFTVSGTTGFLNTIRKWGGALISMEVDVLETVAERNSD